MNLVWATKAYHYDKAASTDETISDVEKILKRDGHVTTGDIFIILASMPIQARGRSNMIKVHVVS
jgi:pyruvate kinase